MGEREEKKRSLDLESLKTRRRVCVKASRGIEKEARFDDTRFGEWELIDGGRRVVWILFYVST